MNDGAFSLSLYPSHSDQGWRRILAQEGLPYLESEEPISPVTVFATRLPSWFESYVSRGGTALVSGAAKLDGLLLHSQPAVIHRFRPPGRDAWCRAPAIVRLFEGPGRGEMRLHEDRKVRGGNEPDRFAAVLSKGIGEGTVIFSGIPLTELLTAAGDSLRQFSPFTDVTERVASVDKAEVADTLVWMLQTGFRQAGLPYVRPVRFPDGVASVLILRVDVDGLFGDRARRLAEVSTRCGIRASFFFNGSLCEEHPGDLGGWWQGHEVGNHGYMHDVFEGVDENRVNLERGAAWVRQVIGVEAPTFVAPRGLWNRGLEGALATLGYRSSADFGLEFDSLPFRTAEGIWQVPVHPYSPERAHVFAEDHGLPPPTADIVRRHYLNVLASQAQRGRPVHVYGHPEVLGAMADEVVPALADAAHERGIPSLSLAGFLDWWKERDAARLSLVVHRDEQEVEIGFEGEAVPVEVWAAERCVVRVNGRRTTAPAGAAALVIR